MAQPAWDTIEGLDPKIVDRVKACVQIAGWPTLKRLKRALEQRGHKDPDVVEVGLALPEDQYEQLVALNDRLPERTLPKIRRRR